MPDIHHRFTVNSPIQKVFETFCTPAGLNNWWSLECSGKPQLNETYRFYFGPEYDWNAKVIHVVEGKELTWQMTKAMDDWMPTHVGFKLQENNGVTNVYFFHKGWEKENEHFAITNFCWGQLLKGLKDYCETGANVPFEKRN